MPKVIDSFSGDYEFLSNFYPCNIEVNGLLHTSVEHVFQASKAVNTEDYAFVRAASSAAEAKKRGRKLSKIRKDWDTMRVEVMLEALRAKFTLGTKLANLLLSTDDSILIEGNMWGDTYWGVYNNEGFNMLGMLLMQVRKELFDFVHRRVGVSLDDPGECVTCGPVCDRRL